MPELRPLDAYPRPGVTVDLAIMTVSRADSDPVLRVLLQSRLDPPGLALPGAFIRERRTVAETCAEVLGRKVAIDPDKLSPPTLLQVFDEPYRDDRTWAISLAHSMSLSHAELMLAPGELVRVTLDGRLEDQPGLLFDHDRIVRAAIERLRSRYEIRYRFVDVRPDPDQFLPEPFTLHQLRRLHEAVLGSELHKDNFNRRMKPYLTPVMHGDRIVLSKNLRGRPATLYVKARE